MTRATMLKMACGLALVGGVIFAASVAPVRAEDPPGQPMVVHFPDCGQTLCVLPKGAVAKLFERANDADRLEEELARERASKEKRCAVVTPPARGA